jgi:hypothetical protein
MVWKCLHEMPKPLMLPHFDAVSVNLEENVTMMTRGEGKGQRTRNITHSLGEQII